MGNLKMMKVLVFMIVLFFSTLMKGEVVELHDTIEDLKLRSSHFGFYEDVKGGLNYPFEGNVSWQDISEEDFYVSNSSSTFWLKLDVINLSNGNKNWVIECLDIYVQEIAYFIINEKGDVKKGVLGAALPFNKRPFKTTNFVIDLDLEKYETKKVLLKIKSHEGSSFAFRLRKTSFFVNYAIHEFFALGLFYGVLLIIVVYNLLVFFTTKDKSYAFYVLYVLGSVFYTFEETGYGYKFLWPNNPEWSDSIYYLISPLFFLLSYTLFAVHFLELKKVIGRHLIKILGVVAFSSVYLIIEFFLPFELPTVDIFIIPFLLIFISAIFSYRYGVKFSRYFVLGNAFVLIGLFINLCRVHDLFNGNIFTVYAFHFGLVIEIILFSMGLGDRIKIIKDERNDAQFKVIEGMKLNEELQMKVTNELEEKVSQRTIQLKEKTIALETSNAQLEELTQQLNEMNSKLDYDNWKLNKTVKEQSFDRFLAKNLSETEFFKLFPDEQSSRKFLKKLKWEESFSCKKCGYNNFKEDKTYSRKCSKCGKVESVTSHTLFHGVRFPLNKALYLTYLFYRTRKVKINELALSLELGKASCSKFRIKVDQRIFDFEKKHEVTPDNWIKLILD